MAGLDLSSLSALETNVAGLLPNQTDVLQGVVTSAAAGVVLSGLKAQMGNGALDPLGLFANTHPANNPNAVVGPTITASAYAALPAAAQASLVAGGVHIVAG